MEECKYVDQIQEILKSNDVDDSEVITYSETNEIIKVKMSLSVLREDIILGHLIDNPKYTQSPFEIIEDRNNYDILLLKIRDLFIVIDCITKPGEILWKQANKQDETVSLRHLLYRVSKLSIGDSSKILVDSIIKGLDIYNILMNDIDDYYLVSDLEANGLNTVSLQVQNKKNIKYLINIQFEKITVWNKLLDKCILETETPDKVVDQLLVELLNDV